MACERCGCRMVVKAKGGRGGLICTDCGHRADPLQHGDRLRRAWFGALALLAIALVGGLTFTLAMLQEAHHPAPAAESRGQEPSE